MAKRAWLVVILLIALVPIGLITDNPAWGEWDIDKLEKMVGFIPKGIKDSHQYSGIFSDYTVSGFGSISGYYISAIVGVTLLLLIYSLLHYMVKRK